MREARVSRVEPTIRVFDVQDREALVALALRAWVPVHASLEHVLGEAGGYAELHPDWRIGQREAVEAACRDDQTPVWVAEIDGQIVGFVVAQLDRQPGLGEVVMIAVDPARQERGVGTALTSFAVNWLRENGMTVAMIETGGDPGHAPARRLYEQTGFVLLPIARYFKKL